MSESNTDTTLYSDMTLLCIDDESSILRTLQRLFHRKPYKVLIADSAKSALKIIADTPVDVIVSDMRMPEMDGATLLQKVANSHPHIYRIVLSGFADFEATVAAINLGKINRFINKPWNNEELINSVEEGLERIRLKNENINLKHKIENQNKLLKSLNSDLEERVNLRTKQIKASLLRNERNNKACEKMLFNFIAINPEISGGFAKNISHLAGRLGEQLGLDKDALHDVCLAGLLSEIGLLGLDPLFYSTPYNLLNFEQRKIFMSQGLIAQQILSPAQHLNGVTEILTHQFSSLETILKIVDSKTLLACKIINIARDYWRFSCGKIQPNKMDYKQIHIELTKAKGIKYDVDILELLIAKPELVDNNINELGLKTDQISPKMILKHSVFSNTNLLILAEGHELTEHSINKLIEYESNQKSKFVIIVEQ
jgi:response regulator RpfG family c-di-GMP phosphodiesterase